MKKFFTFLLPFSLLASAALSSCSDGCTGDPDPTPELPDGYTYATENSQAAGSWRCAWFEPPFGAAVLRQLSMQRGFCGAVLLKKRFRRNGTAMNAVKIS